MMFLGFTPIEITQILVGLFGCLNVGFGLVLFILKKDVTSVRSDVHEIKVATNGLMAARDVQIEKDAHAAGVVQGEKNIHAEAGIAAIKKAEQTG